MSILSLPRHHTKARPDQAAIPVARTSSVPAGSHLTGRDNDRPITFDDIRRQPDPTWSLAAAGAASQQAYRDAEDAYRALAPAGMTYDEHLLREVDWDAVLDSTFAPVAELLASWVAEATS